MLLRKTKIVCTVGPAVQDIEVIEQLLREGMNVARFNFSHGDHEYHGEMVKNVRKASQNTGIPVALLLDTKGPEIRTGKVAKRNIKLIEGEDIILTTDDILGTEKKISVSYKNLPAEVSRGKHIYIADGVVDLEVETVVGEEIHCNIRQGGVIGSRKNLNVRGVKTNLPAITDKDREDIKFGIENKFDFIAASFVRKSSNIMEIRKILDKYQSRINLIAKIEDEEGVENIDDIINVSDGIMVARGDLGVQLSTEDIPIVQKRIIKKCNKANKPVITATQMLDSMINNPRPTRAEASDVANAIFDGTDAVMLSGETASGNYPELAVKTMRNIAIRVENSSEYVERMRVYFQTFATENDIAQAIAKASFITASNIDASAILTPTMYGTTPKLISKYRPQQTIIAATTTEEVQRNLLLYWGIYPIVTEKVSDSDHMTINALKISLEKRYVRNSDKVVMVAGIPINSPVMLNTIRVHVISNVLGKSTKGSGKMVTGRIIKAKDLSEAALRIQGDGSEILMLRKMDESYKPLLSRISGIIVEDFSTISFEEMQMINKNLVILTGVQGAFESFEDDLIVTLDGEDKLIYEGVVESK